MESLPLTQAERSQSTPSSPRTFTCSFIEFDERGDYLNFQQHSDEVKWIEDNTPPKSPDAAPLFVVIYCHGWRHNSQSDDVVRFNDFLGRMSIAQKSKSKPYRIHGIYLAWRGDSVKTKISPNDGAYGRMAKLFGVTGNDTTQKQLIDPSQAVSNPWLDAPLEPFRLGGFFFRKSVAESSASIVPIARTIFTIADTVKTRQTDSKVYLIGHSFGALMLEKALGQACVARLSERYTTPEFTQANAHATIPSPNPLPFDCVLFLNSAAPSLYAKELSDLFWTYNMRWLGEDYVTHRLGQGKWPPTVPVIVSVTSEGDWATGWASPIGTRLSTLFIAPWEYSTLSHDYTHAVLWDKNQNEEPNYTVSHDPVPQRYFYEHTPGHNPLLVDHWVVPVTGKELEGLRSKWPFAPTPAASPAEDHGPEEVTAHNRHPCTKRPYISTSDIFYFDTVTRMENGKPGDTKTWKLIDRNTVEELATTDPNSGMGKEAKKVYDWSQSYTHAPNLVPFPRPSQYWIVRCPGTLIKDHGDIWNDKAMEFYVALFSHIEHQRDAHPSDPKFTTEPIE
jgi:hypothetical protein